jgi:hypothetical protein
VSLSWTQFTFITRATTIRLRAAILEASTKASGGYVSKGEASQDCLALVFELLSSLNVPVLALPCQDEVNGKASGV